MLCVATRYLWSCEISGNYAYLVLQACKLAICTACEPSQETCSEVRRCILKVIKSWLLQRKKRETSDYSIKIKMVIEVTQVIQGRSKKRILALVQELVLLNCQTQN